MVSSKLAPSVVAPGNHDGVHLGHQALIGQAAQNAGQAKISAVAMFFDPHPNIVVAPERAPEALTTVARRTELLLAAGADRVYVHPFDATFAKLPPEAFVTDILVACLQARAIVVGPDFRFGANRGGDLTALRRFGQDKGIDIELAESVTLGGARVSSTRVRDHLRRGQVEQAAQLLGRVHDVEGVVCHGDGRGRTLGYPTANLTSDAVMWPAHGVYAVAVRILGEDGPVLHGVANLGTRPTFDAGEAMEVHLLHHDGNLYGKRLRVGFRERLRGERRFGSPDDLKAQIAQDVAQARRSADSAQGEWLQCL